MPTLHLHLDESGDLAFKPKSTTHYVFAAAWTHDPAPLARELAALRFGLLKRGHNLQRFHAAEDKQVNRDAVVTLMAAHKSWQFAAVVVEKRKVYPGLRDPRQFYPKFAGSVLKYVFNRHVQSGTDRVIIFTDTLPVNKLRDAAEKTIKLTCRRELPKQIPFCVYHHASASNTWLQVADYCAWAVFKKWERGDHRTYNQLQGRLAEPELDALRAGTKLHY